MQICSDVHLEFRGDSPVIIKRNAPVLALLGDIGNPFSPNYAVFLQQMAEKFDRVIVLAGNHEYYGHTITATEEQIQRVCIQGGDNITFLQRGSYDLNDETRVIGCTLWSAIDDHTPLNDFRHIRVMDDEEGLRLLEPRDIRAFHERDVAWLKLSLRECERLGKKAIVLTHHGTASEMSGKYKGQATNCGFVTPLDWLKVWCVVTCSASGHTHSNVDVILGSTRFVSNCMGYPGEEGVGYREDVIVEVY